MNGQFDPYRKWLGISPEDQPPTYYRLLGLSAFESDLEVISNAADRQMAHVRSFQSGKYSAYSQEILNQLATARVCLLDPARKMRYDAQLQAAMGSRVTAVPMSPGMAAPPSSVPVGTPIMGPGSPPVGMAVYPGQSPYPMPPAGLPSYLPPGVVPEGTLPDDVEAVVTEPLGSTAFGDRRGSSRDSGIGRSSAARKRRANSSKAGLIMAVLGLAVILALVIVAWKTFEEEPLGLPGVAPDKKPKVHAPLKPAPTPEKEKPAPHPPAKKIPNP